MTNLFYVAGIESPSLIRRLWRRFWGQVWTEQSDEDM
jgi:hypothetical protein